jgi:predicted dienelactone hydrolase
LCGTIVKRHDKRIKALLLLSTSAGGYLYRETELADVKIPSMAFLGERERGRKRGNRTMGELTDKVFGNLPPPKYFLEIKGANHFSFNNRLTDNRAARFFSGNEDFFEVIREYLIAFLEKHVARKKGFKGVLERQDPLLTRYVKQR